MNSFLPLKSILSLVLFFSLSASNAYADTNSDVTIVANGKIYTSDIDNKTVKAFAYKDKRFIATGSAEELRSKYSNANYLDLKGATVVPGFIDSHGHLLNLGTSLLSVDLVGSSDKREIVSRLKAFAADLPEGQWLLGRGWDQNDWPVKELPTAKDLDTAFPERPVWIERIDGHAGWANSAAIKLATKDPNGDWQPDGGEILRDDNGKASGVFIDKASALIDNAVPAANAAHLIEALQRAMEKTASVGLTAMHDAGTSKEVWDLISNINAKKELKVRVYAMADGSSKMLDFLCTNGKIVDSDAMLTARSVKLYSDGALGSRGAALLAPYTDRPKQSGLLIESPETLSKYAKRAADCGLQVNIHAIGDRGNRVTLDALQAASNNKNPGRHRIEHSQVIEASDFARFKQLGLIASVQPTHATSDMYWAEDRVGAERIKGAYAWQSLDDLGIPLALGSDFPVEQPDPLHGFYAAISRQDAKGWPENGWYPSQSLSREQALHGFTLGGAYAAFQEDQLGSIEVGKFADFVILSKDIMTIPAIEILSTEIAATYINGESVYSR